MTSRNYLLAALAASLFIGPLSASSYLSDGSGGSGDHGDCDDDSSDGYGGDDDCDHDGGGYGDDDDCDENSGDHHDDDGDCDDNDGDHDHEGDCGDDDDDGHHDDDDGDCGGGDCTPPVSFCDSGCYTLGNKVTGVVAPPNYGLRLDGLFGAAGDHYTFDFEAPDTGVEMCYDGNGLISIEGIAYGGLDIGGEWDSHMQGFLEISFTFENASCEDGSLLVLESHGGHGFGSVTWVNTGEIFFLTGKANSVGEVFLVDGAQGQEARGWVEWDQGLVGDFSMVIEANSNCPPVADCDGDMIPDSEEADCDANGIPDDCEPEADCDENGIPDVCDLADGGLDADGNGVLDICEPGIEIYCTGDGDAGGTSVECPCGNNVLPGAQEGCLNSTGFGASLTATGTPSILAGDLELHVSGGPEGVPGFYFSGSAAENGGMGSPFLSGLRCVGGELVRMGKTPEMTNGESSYPFPGSPSIAQLLGVTAGQTTYFQYWYRDPSGPCGASANTTNGLRVIWGY